MASHARPIDTSTLGPIRIVPRRAARARQLLAEGIRAQGPGYANAADTIRDGAFSNIWIAGAVTAIERLLEQGIVDEE